MRSGSWRQAILALGLASCAAAPRVPPFQGKETESWLAYEVPSYGRQPVDLLASFEASAHSYGCRTERVDVAAYAIAGGKPLTGGESRYSDGVVAACGDANVALMAQPNGAMVLGCTKPTTAARCDELLEKIANARE